MDEVIESNRIRNIPSNLLPYIKELKGQNSGTENDTDSRIRLLKNVVA